ncbi:Uncharacterised protein [Pseudomonas fluorescens]|uniref:Transmembrane protein n=1 Tax=Pseudomonas fluorescens TaxID=294 RepID=A0A379IKV8_PSEFL|nr:hypothetical protein [Pseudomonas fluorescens]AIG03557.1 hypothetical protein HZ99_15820 [Pseudomonas fluorescens]SUD33976.1 Uncharacterised protein [Pseudomonas fluorescens]
MWLFDVFAWLYTLTPFTGALLLWFLVLVVTAGVTMKYPTRRGKLAGFGISSVGAVLILGYLEVLTLSATGKELKGVVINLVVMSLGGLGSGLLAVAISEGPSKAEIEQTRTSIRTWGLTVFEYLFVFVLVCSLVLSAICLPLWFLGWPKVPVHAVLGLLLAFLGAALGCVMVFQLRRLMKWEQLGVGLLFGLLLLLLPVYAQAVWALVNWSLAAVLGFHLVAGIAMGWTVWRNRLAWQRAPL